MKKITFFALLLFVVSFTACRKEDTTTTTTPVTPAAAIKKVQQINIETIDPSAANEKEKTMAKYFYNPNGTIEHDYYEYFDKNQQSIDNSTTFYEYRPNVLEMLDENKKSIAYCHLNSDGFVTVDSSGYEDYSLDTYDNNKYKVKSEVINKKSKKVVFSASYKYENERLVSETIDYLDLFGSSENRTVYEETYIYDKQILNTINGAYVGVNFTGKISKYLCTKKIAKTTTYEKSTNKVLNTSSEKSDFTYETNAEGYVTKRIEKSYNDANKLLSETTSVYTYQ
jgi:hypothetical protein